MSFFVNQLKIKRTFDIFLSYVGLFFLSPIWCLISFVIWLEDGSPIFYIQERLGLGGTLFKAIKFRTMGYKKENSRLAKLLRTTALDELPQLINIIKGQMSFVGPRPLIPEEIPQDEIISFRLKVRPGLTGIAQILVSKEAPIFKKAEYDLWYIKNQSIGLDISLIFKSFWYSITRRWDRLGR